MHALSSTSAIKLQAVAGTLRPNIISHITTSKHEMSLFINIYNYNNNNNNSSSNKLLKYISHITSGLISCR